MSDSCKRLSKHLANARRELRKAHAISKVHSDELDELGGGKMLGASKLFERWTMEAESHTSSLQRTLKELGC